MKMKMLRNIITVNVFIQVIVKAQKDIAPQYQIVQFGQDTRLECSSVTSAEEFTQNVYWTKRRDKSSNSITYDLFKDIPKDLRYIVDEKDYSLTIRNIKSKDVGSYTCNVLNKNGYNQNTIILNISKQRPEIRRKPRSKSARSEQNIKFRCRVSGYPEPSITWLHNGLPISSEKDVNTRYQTTSFVSSTALISASLVIKNVKKSDQGEYTCLAQNDIGKDRGKQSSMQVKLSI